MRAPAPAKLNLALVVGPAREDGKHEVATVLQRIDLGDRVAIAAAPSLQVTGFAGDTLVREALVALAAAAGIEPRWSGDDRQADPGRGRARRRQLRRGDRASPRQRHASPRRCPTSAYARSRPRSERTSPSSSRMGRSSVAGTGPSSRRSTCRRTTGSSSCSRREPARTRPRPSTGASTSATGRRAGSSGAWRSNRRSAAVRRPRDLAALPPNDLASSPLAGELLRLGAFRADVSGAGPTVYGLFHHRRHAEAARRALRSAGRTWLTVPAWYG